MRRIGTALAATALFLIAACSTTAPAPGGKACTNDGDCTGDLRCGYDVSKGCSATKGVCIALASGTVPDSCGCDGELVASVAPGYASSPATSNDAACADAGVEVEAGGGDAGAD